MAPQPSLAAVQWGLLGLLLLSTAVLLYGGAIVIARLTTETCTEDDAALWPVLSGLVGVLVSGIGVFLTAGAA